MATSVTSAGLVAASDKVILAARPVIELVKLFSTDLSVEPAKKGAGVAVEVLSAVAGDFGANNGYTKSTNSIKPASVTLNKHKKATYTVSDVDALQNELAPCWNQFGPSGGLAVAKAIATDAMTLLTAAAAASSVTNACADLAGFAAVRAAAVAAHFDPADCVLVLNPATYSKLLSLTPANILGSDEAIRRGQLGAFLGFKAVVESPSAATLGFIVPTGALAIAARVVAPVRTGGNLVEFGTVQDETTGIAFGQRVVVDADQGTCSWTVDCLYGVALTKQSSNGAPGYICIQAPAAATPSS